MNPLRSLIIAVVLALLVFTGVEFMARGIGVRPSQNDDAELWHYTRWRIARERAPQVVVLGSSRIEAAIDPETYASETGHRPLSLAMNTGGPIQILEDLARDADFRGLILCDVAPLGFFMAGDMFETRPATLIREYKTITAANLLETYVRSRYRAAFAIAHRAEPFTVLLTALAGARVHQVGVRDRERFNRIRHRNWPGLPKHREFLRNGHRTIGTPMYPEQVAAYRERIARAVQLLQQRESRLVFLRPPSSGMIRAVEAERWPRAKYWDAIAAGSIAHTVHFEDHPELQDFNQPDESHIEGEDAPRFTRALLEILGSAAVPPES